jgi:hypothetical protein
VAAAFLPATLQVSRKQMNEILTVKIHRVKKFKGASAGRYYYFIKEVDTTRTLSTENSLSEACKKVDDEGWILQPD